MYDPFLSGGLDHQGFHPLEDPHAVRLRDRFHADATLAVHLIASPGAGKTSLLESTASRLGGDYRLAAVKADAVSERDAERLQRQGIPARAILTGWGAHLDARRLHAVMREEKLFGRDIFFLENVGDLVCPIGHDLGEDFKVALLSVTQGGEEPFKYPAVFARAAVTVISKADLLPHVDFDLNAVRDEIHRLNPGARILLTSARVGQGIDAWCVLLQEKLEAKRALFAWTT